MLRLLEVCLQAGHADELHLATIVTTVKIDRTDKLCILPPIS